MSFRGINTTVIQIRRQVFTEVARMAYANVKGEQANHLMRKIPYTIIPGEEGKLRKDIFLERAIVEERVRLAMGLPTRRMDEHNSVVSGLEDASIADKYYDPPLVNVIKFACNRCPEKLVKVSDLCQGCLAHPCMEVCPKKAITWESGRSTIDQEKCIKCGRCVGVCPYNAIVKTERPCAAACGMGAIHSDELGRAEIDYSKCVSCGQCLVNCPFGAIADKGQIYQLIQGFNRGDRIYALVAPAFINQFPSLASTGKLKSALKAIGFCDVVEVAIGADLCTVASGGKKCVRIRLDLFPQFADKGHDVAVVQQVIIRPYRPVDLFFGEHLAPVLRQKPEDVELLGGQADFPALHEHPAAFRENFQFSQLQALCRGGCFSFPGGTQQQGGHLAPQ